MKFKPFSALFFLLILLAFGANFAFAQSQQSEAALRSYRQGRDFEARGRSQDAARAYSEAIEICRQNLEANPSNMDAYAICCWSLVRLNRWQDAVNTGRAALALGNDMRIIETMGEAYFYLNNYNDSLRSMQRYADELPSGDRIGTAYFFMAEIYRLTGRHNLAEFAYTVAVYYEPSLPLWWYRLGTMREETGDNSGAVEAYERVLRLQRNFRDAEERLRRARSRA